MTGPRSTGPVLIVGGAGFIGSNLAAHLARAGRRVRIYDDLSRPGVEQNLAWLRREHRDRVDAIVASVQHGARLREAIAGTSAVFHFAAQTAVTTSLVEPRADFDVNARGTLEVLEAVRAQPTPPVVVFTSTNKVYGCLTGLALRVAGERWRPVDDHVAAFGVSEAQPLAFATPYGCSKGCADQYVLDYAHTYGVPATVFRMSCIYGPRQFGTEDQGWVAHFLIRALAGQPITIYGDGRQVRDVLFVDDLVDAFVRAEANPDAVRGRAFNLGGGPAFTLSLREVIAALEPVCGRRPAVAHGDWRAGDQRWYVSDTRAFEAATGWRARVAPADGLAALATWLRDERRRAPTVPAIAEVPHVR